MSDKLKAASALSEATKGLSRVQAERAAANATRNVNAYGQKEEGPSRWQEKKELKTQMYLKSTEKQATLNQKRCQKCQQTGHWTYECHKQVPEKTKLDIKSLMSQDVDKTDVKKDEKKKKEKGSKGRKKRRKERSRSSSDESDSESDHEDDRKRKKRKKHSRR